MAKLGRPTIEIDFKSKATSAITRSGRGVGVMILNDSTIDTLTHYQIIDSTEIPSGIDDKSITHIKNALLGIPAKLHVLLIPPLIKQVTTTREVENDDGETETITEVSEVAATVTQADALTKASTLKFNYICHPTGSQQAQSDLATWVKNQRRVKQKTYKAVVSNVKANSYGIINFTTGDIKVVNPVWSDALIEAEGVESAISATIAKYLTYTAGEYTARIMGILLGLSLDRSVTYYELSEVESCSDYQDIDESINNGELCLIDEGDGHGVKIARGVNSLTTFTTDVGEDFRFIKIVEAIDLIKDDIRDTFRDDYIGKVINDYDHKMLFIAAILIYFEGLKGNVLDNSTTAVNKVEIDYEANRDYAKLKGEDVSEMTNQQILEYHTGTQVFLTGQITPVNAMEDLKITFYL